MHLYGELHRFYQPWLTSKERELQSASAPPCSSLVEVNMGYGGRSGGNGFVNDFVYEDIPDTTHARIWAVWSAFDAVGTVLDFT